MPYWNVRTGERRGVVMIDHPIESPAAWTGRTVSLSTGRLVLDRECLAEIEAVAATLRANPLPVLALSPADFDLVHCRRVAAKLRMMLDDGPGFAIVDRLPLHRLRREDARAVLLPPSPPSLPPVA